MRAWRIVTGLALASLAAVPVCRVLGGPNAGALRSEVEALEAERDQLRRRVDARMAANPRLRGMPESPVRVGIPTSLLREILERLAGGAGDQVRLELTGIKARHRGEVRKLVSLGRYDLHVTIDRLEGRLRAGKPQLRFGGDHVAVSLPVAVESGAGHATLHFVWEGKNVSGAVCGDLDVRQVVSGRVRPESFLIRGGLDLKATEQAIIATPRFPPTKLRLHIEPAPVSWRAVKRILQEKKGACAFVLDKIDVPALLQGLLDKGILVRLPTEKVPKFAVPIRIEPTIAVRGQPVRLAIRVGRLAITEHDLWLGAQVSLRPPIVAAASAGTATAPPSRPSAAAAAGPSAGEIGLSARTTPPEP